MYYFVQMQNRDGSWFDLYRSKGARLSDAKRQAVARVKRNTASSNPVMRKSKVRIVSRIETVIEELTP